MAKKSVLIKIKQKNNNTINVKFETAPRNNVVVALLARAGSGAGSHGKSNKAKRNQNKRELKKIVFEL